MRYLTFTDEQKRQMKNLGYKNVIGPENCWTDAFTISELTNLRVTTWHEKTPDPDLIVAYFRVRLHDPINFVVKTNRG